MSTSRRGTEFDKSFLRKTIVILLCFEIYCTCYFVYVTIESIYVIIFKNSLSNDN